MRDLVRESAVGQCIRFLGGKCLFPYPEERADFCIPEEYSATASSEASQDAFQPAEPLNEEKESAGVKEIKNYTVLVTWYSENDKENPRNWSTGRKAWISSLLLVYTVSCYIGSALYAASEPDVMSIFHVGDTVAALGLSLYVLGYGIGPLLFGPLSEIPIIGRNPAYIWSYIIFVALSLATALVDNIPGLLILRFLLGFFAAPALANAGASYGDFFEGKHMPYVICFWGGGTTISPAIGPLLSGFAVEAEGWRWSSWILFWFAGPALILVLLALPETSEDNILLRRAQRLRELTGRTDLRSASEIKQAQMSARQVALDALVKPWEINALDPAVLFTTAYTALTYALYYSFFEAFPLVYEGIYGFSLGELGLTYLSILIGLLVGVLIYCSYFYFIGDPQMATMASVPPEARLTPGLAASFLIPAGLFIFAWTSRASIHWIVGLVGVAISMCGVFIIIQCMLIYLPFVYPQYSGSLFAANAFARSSFAAGAILFAGPLFNGLGIGGGVSLLAGLNVLCIAGIFAIYYRGAALRKRSRFATS